MGSARPDTPPLPSATIAVEARGGRRSMAAVCGVLVRSVCVAHATQAAPAVSATLAAMVAKLTASMAASSAYSGQVMRLVAASTHEPTAAAASATAAIDSAAARYAVT